MLPIVGPKTLVVTFQNGIDSADILSKYVGREQVVRGAYYISAHLASPGMRPSRSPRERGFLQPSPRPCLASSRSWHRAPMAPPITSLDLEMSGIGTIVWCTGFDGDFSWLKVRGAIGADQQPSHVDGIGVASGIYFAGLDFASTRKSGTILASSDESRTIVGHILGRLGQL